MTAKRVRGDKSMQRLDGIPRSEFAELEQLPNVGPAFAADMRLLGIDHPRALIGRDPFALFNDLCRATGRGIDPCVIDQFLAAVRFMEGGEAKPWWAFTAERKRVLAARGTDRRTWR